MARGSAYLAYLRRQLLAPRCPATHSWCAAARSLHEALKLIYGPGIAGGGYVVCPVCGRALRAGYHHPHFMGRACGAWLDCVVAALARLYREARSLVVGFGGGRPARCGVCGRSLGSRAEAARHVLLEHLVPERGWRVVELCGGSPTTPTRWRRGA